MLLSKQLNFSPSTEAVYFDYSLPANKITSLERYEEALLIEKSLKNYVISPKTPLSMFKPNKNIAIGLINIINGKLLRIQVLVKNLAYDKHVCIHCTFNYWKSTHIISLSFDSTVVKSNPKLNIIGIDKFITTLDITKYICNDNAQNRNDIEFLFAVRYEVNNEVIWNNNDAKNFSIVIYTPFF